jgi:hypothetical protein
VGKEAVSKVAIAPFSTEIILFLSFNKGLLRNPLLKERKTYFIWSRIGAKAFLVRLLPQKKIP